MSARLGRQRARRAARASREEVLLEQQVLGRIAGDAPARGTARARRRRRARSRCARGSWPRCRRCRRRWRRSGRGRCGAGRHASIIGLGAPPEPAVGELAQLRVVGRRGPRAGAARPAAIDALGARPAVEDHRLAGRGERRVERPADVVLERAQRRGGCGRAVEQHHVAQLERVEHLVVGERDAVARTARAGAGRWSGGRSRNAARPRSAARCAAPWSGARRPGPARRVARPRRVVAARRRTSSNRDPRPATRHDARRPRAARGARQLSPAGAACGVARRGRQRGIEQPIGRPARPPRSARARRGRRRRRRRARRSPRAGRRPGRRGRASRRSRRAGRRQLAVVAHDRDAQRHVRGQRHHRVDRHAGAARAGRAGTAGRARW